MHYAYFLSKTEPYTVTSTQFPNIKSTASSQEAAFNKFITEIFNHIKECLRDDIIIPIDDTITRTKSQTFGLPLNVVLKLKLHNLRVQKHITRKQLSQFLAVTSSDMGDLEWNIKNLKKISANKIPKYKNVQRLFDLSHVSTTTEMEAAYRVLGYNVQIIPQERI